MRSAAHASIVTFLTCFYLVASIGSTHAADDSKARADVKATHEARLMIKHGRDIEEQSRKLSIRNPDGRPTFQALVSICDSRCQLNANRCRLALLRADLVGRFGDILNERAPYNGAFEIPALDQERPGGDRPAVSTGKCDKEEAACVKRCACLSELQ